MRANIYQLGKTLRSIQCKKRRSKVRKNVTETNTFTGAVKGEAVRINQ